MILKMHPLAVGDCFERLSSQEMEGLDIVEAQDSRIHVKVDCSSRQPSPFEDAEFEEEESKEEEEEEDWEELCEGEDQAELIFEVKRTES